MHQTRHVKPQGRCKLCQLLKQDLSLFDEVHRRLLIQKQQPATVVKWLNGRVEMKNLSRDEKITPFSQVNFHTHLKKHITDEGQLIRAITLKPPPMTSSTFKKIEVAAANMMINPTLKKPSEESKEDGLEPFDIFEECENSSTALLHSLRHYRRGIEKDIRSGSRPNAANVKSMYEMLVAAVQLQKSLNQVQNSSRVAGEALQRMAELIAIYYAQQLLEVTSEAEKLLSGQIEGSLPSEVATMIRDRMSDSVHSALELSYQTVLEEFGIK